MITKVFVRRSASDVVPAEHHDIVLDLLSTAAASNITNNITRIRRRFNLSLTSVDLLALAICVYVSDKKVRRIAQSDGWTRSYRVDFPVSNLRPWNSAKKPLTEALTFLTGDDWTFHFRQDASLNSIEPAELEQIDYVTLFSGGLDSLIGAIDVLESHENARCLLVAHHDSTVAVPTQDFLTQRLQQQYGAHRVNLVKITARPAPTRSSQEFKLPVATEPSTRSRSFLFIAAGLALANSASNDLPLIVPENGFISINAALSCSRLGSCSTRTTHPHFLGKLAETINRLGVSNKIWNPYQFKTKGEMLDECKNNALLDALGSFSISCTHPEVAHWLSLSDRRRKRFGSAYGNCGYCYPCIIRRAAFYHVNKDDQQHAGKYLYDITQEVDLFKKHLRINDARAVFDFLSNDTPGSTAVLATGRIPPALDLNNLVQIYERGKNEIRQFFEDGASDNVKEFTGI